MQHGQQRLALGRAFNQQAVGLQSFKRLQQAARTAGAVVAYAKEVQALAATNAANAKQFLVTNAKKTGVVTTASGLQYQVLKTGTGKSPKATDKVKVNYEGRLADGTIFDSSYKRGEAVTFPLNQVIKGWTEGVQLMKEGAKYRLFVPPALGYGEAGNAEIEPNSLLIFDVELLQVNPTAGK